MKAKGFLAVLLILILTVIPITAASGYNGAVAELEAGTKFTPRLTAPAKSNKYYYSNNNIFYSIGYGMPNCTAYAWGRAYELLGTRPKLSLDSAHYWWGYNKKNNYYPYGKTPKLGAIACWDNPDGGHVAVVEKLTSSTITLSHSEYGGRSFFLTNYARNAANGGSINSSWTFQGYIYIMDGVKEPAGDIYRITSYDGVNMRKGAGTSYATLTAVPYNTEIVVTATKKANGYTWGKTTFDGCTGWCVLDYAKLIYKKPAPTTATKATTATKTTTVSTTTFAPTTAAPTTLAQVPVTTVPPVSTLPLGSDPTEDTSRNFVADVNMDGKTNVSDATALQKYVAGFEIEIDIKIADVNGDGKIDVTDATYIQKAIAGLV